MTNRFTERAQRALNASLSAAADLGHTYIGSEHILLGLMADDASIAAKMLRAHGADRTRVREAVVNMAGEGVRARKKSFRNPPRCRYTPGRATSGRSICCWHCSGRATAWRCAFWTI